MPHQCVNCGAIYGDGDEAILKGCTKCGHKVFFYIRKEKLEEAKKQTEKLSQEDKHEIEKELKSMVGDKAIKDAPVVLDFEAIKVLKPGKFELDIVKLFNKEPLIYKYSEGKYIIDLAETFRRQFEKDEKEKKQ